MKVPYIDLAAQHREIREELLETIGTVLDSGQFILGKLVRSFEQKFAKLSGTKYAIGVASGTDALILSMKVLNIGPGDEVITVPNSFLATASSIILTGAKPVFVDVRDDYNIDPDKIELAITSKTKAIIPVHLTGRPADMFPILKVAENYNIHVIEDAAQAVRAEYHGQRVGSFGTLGCFSLHPLKNLNACGDAGIITTNNPEFYKKLLVLRNHGLINRDECQVWSINSRLDAIQAAILNVKLNYLEKWEMRRREIASIYQEELDNLLNRPLDKTYERSVYHTFVIQTTDRDKLQQFLWENEIDTKIHYPVPIHLQSSSIGLGYKEGDFPITEKLAKNILSLPIDTSLSDNQIGYTCSKINQFHINNY